MSSHDNNKQSTVGADDPFYPREGKTLTWSSVNMRVVRMIFWKPCLSTEIGASIAFKLCTLPLLFKLLFVFVEMVHVIGRMPRSLLCITNESGEKNILEALFVPPKSRSFDCFFPLLQTPIARSFVCRG